MDVEKLNNEIISCRGAVRRARVSVIRKIIKKMKILKTCKLEGVKEKKLRKSERLFEKVQIMKKVKDDEVTKFALQNNNLEVFQKGSDLRMNALACLAKHDAVIKKVNSIREQISNWEKELPVLLDSLKNKKEMENSKKNPAKTFVKNKRGIEKISKTEACWEPKSKTKTVKDELQIEELHEDDESQSNETESIIGNVLKANGKVEKIEDPFFIEKKVLAPKLVLEKSKSSEKNDKKELPRKFTLKKNSNSRTIQGKSLKRNYDGSKMKSQKLVDAKKEEEKLHPSWAAKKVKLIEPFQGKRTKFSDD